MNLNKEDESHSWLMRFKQILQGEPKNKKDLIDLLRDAHDRALIDSETLGMVESVIQLAQLRVRDVMLPKNQMTSVSQDDTLEQVIATVTSSGHSRFPVVGDNPNELTGILHAKDLLRYRMEDAPSFNLHDIIRAATFVPESKRLDLLLREFRSTRNHMALVVDEYGSTSGFITIEDIIEQIIGDIEDEFDIDDETYIKAHGDNHYIVKGHTPISEFNEQLQANFSDQNYDTIGGIVMAQLGYLPECGEVMTIEPFEFKIINADARRIKLMDCFDKRQLGVVKE
ncbi:MAG: magnesium/cobalt efflux protein [Legionellales bacterium RIFCSPHIGHO2_12_FULL_42_9]|nr:MAG: magnesium/cobalt efflux protein [Legionellales bacterium RIFCSPHIGHO2_12_FULL_42_9]